MGAVVRCPCWRIRSEVDWGTVDRVFCVGIGSWAGSFAGLLINLLFSVVHLKLREDRPTRVQ